MKKFTKFYFKTQTFLIVTFFAIVVAAIFFQIVNRMVLKIPVHWPEELARYLIVWITFLAAIAAMRQGAMIGVDILTSRFKGIPLLLLKIFQDLVILGFASVITYNCSIIVFMQIEMEQISPALQVNMAIPYSAILVWGTLTVCEMIIDLVRQVKAFSQGEQPKA